MGKVAKIALGILLLGSLVAFIAILPKRLPEAQFKVIEQYHATDKFIREQVVMLDGNHNSCTGVQVVAPSGKIYTLTASHCRSLLTDNAVGATYENAEGDLIYYVEEDPQSDLLLLSSNHNLGVFVASKIYAHQKVHTLTHGMHLPTYRTDGALLSIQLVQVALFPLTTENMKECMNAPKLKIYLGDPFPLCLMTTYDQMATALVRPGSSGGPLLNSAGDLVGIVSAAADGISAFVTLDDIKRFLKDK